MQPGGEVTTAATRLQHHIHTQNMSAKIPVDWRRMWYKRGVCAGLNTQDTPRLSYTQLGRVFLTVGEASCEKITIKVSTHTLRYHLLGTDPRATKNIILVGHAKPVHPQPSEPRQAVLIMIQHRVWHTEHENRHVQHRRDQGTENTTMWPLNLVIKANCLEREPNRALWQISGHVKVHLIFSVVLKQKSFLEFYTLKLLIKQDNNSCSKCIY